MDHGKVAVGVVECTWVGFANIDIDCWALFFYIEGHGNEVITMRGGRKFLKS